MPLDKLESIKRKIAAMLAKAQSTDSEAEAMAFMAKASAWMEEYQLEEWQLTGGKEDVIGFTSIYHGTPAEPTWLYHVASALARFYGCRMIRKYVGVTKTGKDNRLAFQLHAYGPESARITLELMYPFVVKQVKELGRKHWLMGYSRSEQAGCVRVGNALLMRIQKLILDNEAKAPSNPISRDRALVVVDQVNRLVEQHYPVLNKGRASKILSGGSAAQKLAAGIAIHRQLDNGDDTLSIEHRRG